MRSEREEVAAPAGSDEDRDRRHPEEDARAHDGREDAGRTGILPADRARCEQDHDLRDEAGERADEAKQAFGMEDDAPRERGRQPDRREARQPPRDQLVSRAPEIVPRRPTAVHGLPFRQASPRVSRAILMPV